jgi:polar amino acid transport system substrate-binding protein
VIIKSPDDLVGKRVGITRATLEEATVPKMAPPGTNIVWFDEIGATI